MAGRGTGVPQFFACPEYRRIYWRSRTQHDREWHTVQLTGRKKPRRFDGNQGLRTSDFSREFRCNCGHTGWSTHIDLERMEDARNEGQAPAAGCPETAEPWPQARRGEQGQGGAATSRWPDGGRRRQAARSAQQARRARWLIAP